MVRLYAVCQPGHGFPHNFKLFRDKSESVRHMFDMATTELQNFLATYGYWAVFIFVGIESIGIPFPGETMLLVAAIDAGKTHQLSIALKWGFTCFAGMAARLSSSGDSSRCYVPGRPFWQESTGCSGVTSYCSTLLEE